MRWTSSDGKVTADIEVGNGSVAIYEFSSLEPGRGNAQRALRELRSVYGAVAAIGIGDSQMDSSWRFWQHMHERGLIGHAEDDNNEEVVFKAGKGRHE